jgi:hypothetical protein
LREIKLVDSKDPHSVELPMRNEGKNIEEGVLPRVISGLGPS